MLAASSVSDFFALYQGIEREMLSCSSHHMWRVGNAWKAGRSNAAQRASCHCWLRHYALRDTRAQTVQNDGKEGYSNNTAQCVSSDNPSVIMHCIVRTWKLDGMLEKKGTVKMLRSKINKQALTAASITM